MASTNSEKDLLVNQHLDWTAKQGRILTANGRATDFYSEEKGFGFCESDLPHYHLLRGDTSFSTIAKPFSKSIICGAWSRSYFVGGWECTTLRDETVYNIQTNSLFVDLRIPTSRNTLLPTTATCLQDYTNQELRYYARQHVFGGLSIVSWEQNRFVCVRHHALDWNFVGTPRPRPNKWWIEFQNEASLEKWKEWAYATDEYGQHYYCEQWQRLNGGDANMSVALRKERCNNNKEEDGILVVVGNHFNYSRGHALVANATQNYKDATSLVDAALENGDRETAIAWLSRICGGHGLILSSDNDGWMIDCAIEPWKEGTCLFSTDDKVVVEGNDMSNCCVIWNGERWNVFDSSLDSVQQIKDLFERGESGAS